MNGSRGCARGQFAIASQIALSYLIPASKTIGLYSVQILKRFKPKYFLEDLMTLFSLLSEGKIKPLIADRFPLHEVRKAHYSEYFKQNVKMFDALDFIAELTQHIPPIGVQVLPTNQRTLVRNGVCRRKGARRVESVTRDRC